MADDKTSYLVLGWKTEGNDHAPSFWLRPNAKVGRHSADDLFRVPSDKIAAHTAIIAQSGSGKSFFLGRLLEEILLRTKARCLVFDPNADFRRVDSVQEGPFWENPTWHTDDQNEKKFTHESGKNQFEERWLGMKIRVLTGARIGAKGNRESIQLWWPSLPAQILAQHLAPTQRSDLQYCHRIVHYLGRLLDLQAIDRDAGSNLINEARWLFHFARKVAGLRRLERKVYSRYGADTIGQGRGSARSGVIAFTKEDGFTIQEEDVDLVTRSLVEMAAGIPEYVQPEVERYYFGKAREYESAGVLKSEAQSPWRRSRRGYRLEVVDLPSLEENIRIEAIGALLKSEWARVRDDWEEALRGRQYAEEKRKRDADQTIGFEDRRVPTFIVVDEAHNLMPAEITGPGLETLREDFRRIVAEGRKYGLFLVFITQRPDKLDPLIFSECENKAVMRVGSKSVLDKTREVMGIEDVPRETFDQCREFGAGRALLIGKWAGEAPQVIYGAARRTVEGGGNLGKWWTHVD